jgi:hypothetical protein
MKLLEMKMRNERMFSWNEYGLAVETLQNAKIEGKKLQTEFN